MSKCLIHSWIYINKVSTKLNPFTKKMVLRDERYCVDCDERQISMKQFSDEQKLKLCRMAKVGIKSDWIKYVPGDAIDTQADLFLKLKCN